MAAYPPFAYSRSVGFNALGNLRLGRTEWQKL
jgi:hypothetical protein